MVEEKSLAGHSSRLLFPKIKEMDSFSLTSDLLTILRELGWLRVAQREEERLREEMRRWERKGRSMKETTHLTFIERLSNCWRRERISSSDKKKAKEEMDSTTITQSPSSFPIVWVIVSSREDGGERRDWVLSRSR